MAQVAGAHQLRSVQRLLWTVISEHLNPAERDEVRRAIGGTLIDENESIYDEASALADILGDIQIDTSKLLMRQQICTNPQRDMVETEIRMLMERLQRQAVVSPFNGSSAKARDPDTVIPKQKGRDKAVYDYITTTSPALQAMESSTLGSSASASASTSGGRPTTAQLRPGTASTRPGTSTSLRSSRCSRPSTASSAGSSGQYTDASSVVASVQDKLNVYSIDAVKETLRGALQEERGLLLEDVEYLTGLLEEEADLQVKAAAPLPSLTELKEYSTRLAEAVASEESRVEHEARVGAMFAAAEAAPGAARRLRGMVAVSRDHPSGEGREGGEGGEGEGGAGGSGRGGAALPSSTGPGIELRISGARSARGGENASGSSYVTTSERLVVHDDASGGDEDGVASASASVPASAAGSASSQTSPFLTRIGSGRGAAGPAAAAAASASASASAAASGLASPQRTALPPRPPSGRLGAAGASAGLSPEPSAGASSSLDATSSRAAAGPGPGPGSGSGSRPGSSGTKPLPLGGGPSSGPSVSASSLPAPPGSPAALLRRSPTPGGASGSGSRPGSANDPPGHAPGHSAALGALGSPGLGPGLGLGLGLDHAPPAGLRPLSLGGRLRPASPGRTLAPLAAPASPMGGTAGASSSSAVLSDVASPLRAPLASTSSASASAAHLHLHGGPHVGVPGLVQPVPGSPGGSGVKPLLARIPSSAAHGTSPALGTAGGLGVGVGVGMSPSLTGATRGVKSIVEQLEAEVESVKGGVAAILARHQYRPSTPERRAAGAKQ